MPSRVARRVEGDEPSGPPEEGERRVAERSVAPGVVRPSVMVESIHSGMAGLAKPERRASGSSVARGTMGRSSFARAAAISSA